MWHECAPFPVYLSVAQNFHWYSGITLWNNTLWNNYSFEKIMMMAMLMGTSCRGDIGQALYEIHHKCISFIPHQNLTTAHIVQTGKLSLRWLNYFPMKVTVINNNLLYWLRSLAFSHWAIMFRKLPLWRKYIHVPWREPWYLKGTGEIQI